MKVVSSLALALVFGAVSASAAPKSAKTATLAPKASVNAGKGPKADAMKKQDPSSALQKEGASAKDISNAAGSAAVAAPAAAQTTTDVTAIAPAPKKFSVNWLMYTDYKLSAITQDDADPKNNEITDAGAVQSVRFNYKWRPTTTLRLAFEASNKWGQGLDNEKAKPFTWFNPYVQIAGSNLATLPGTIKTSGFFRLYPAITEATSTTQYGVARGGLTFTKELGRLTMTLDNDSRYIAQRDLSLGGKVTKVAQTKNWLTGSFDLGAGFSIYQSGGTNMQYFNEDNGLKQDPVSLLYAETGVEYAALSNLSITVGVTTEDERNLVNEPLAAYDSKQSAAFLLTSLTF